MGSTSDVRGMRASWAVPAGVTVLVVVAALVLYVLQSHRGLHENGPVLVELWRRGAVVHGHALVLPLARLVAATGLAGDPVRADAAIRLVSAGAAALLVGLVVWRAARRAGPVAGLLLALVVGLAPSLRFFAGAVETRALAAGSTALAVVLASRVTRSRAGGLALTAFGYALACASHASLASLLPGLLLLRLSAEARAGRAAGLREAVLGGLALLAAAAVVAGAVLLADRAFNPPGPAGGSIVLHYLRSASGWSEMVGRPPAGQWLAAEALAPLGALVPLAAMGLLPLWRASRLEAAGHALVVGSLMAAAWAVGARQYGGYVLPAAASLAFLAAEGVAQMARARRALPVLLLLAALVMLAFGLVTAVREAASPSSLSAGLTWKLDAAALPLASTALPPNLFAAVPAPAWLLASLVVALLAGSRRVADRAAHLPLPARRTLPPTALIVLLAAATYQAAAGERFRTCWPDLWHEGVREWAEAARRDLHGADLLLASTPTPQVAWSITYYFGPRWIDLSTGAQRDAPDSTDRRLADDDALVDDTLIDDTLAQGGRLVLADQSLRLLGDATHHRQTLATLARWQSAGRLWHWSPATGLRRQEPR